jgi:hypothetical protein
MLLELGLATLLTFILFSFKVKTNTKTPSKNEKGVKFSLETKVG